MEEELECAICLQKLLYPVTLPCNHKFCFLCVKGIRSSSTDKKCALCRKGFSLDTIDKHVEAVEVEKSNPIWFYSGKDNGWWQYDERSSQDIEEAYQRIQADNKKIQLYIVGFLYTIDFEKMIQFRTSDPSRHRNIKRESPESTKKHLNLKGVAGLRLHDNRSTDNVSTRTVSPDGNLQNQASSSVVDNLADSISSNLNISSPDTST